MMLTRLSTSAPMRIEEVRAVKLPSDAFELPGCDPNKAYPVVFIDAKKGLGAVVEVSGKQLGKPLNVRLQRCGAAKVRLLDREGKPVVGYWPEVDLVLAPGPHRYDAQGIRNGQLSADTVMLANLFLPAYQPNRFLTDDQGRIELQALVPGVTYWLVAGGRVLREFRVQPGIRVDLKEVKVAAE